MTVVFRSVTVWLAFAAFAYAIPPPPKDVGKVIVESAVPDLGYAEARALSIVDGRPLIVVVETENCEPCRRLRLYGIPLARSFLGNARLVYLDSESPEGRALVSSGSFGILLPQLIVQRKVGGTWRMFRMVGYESEDGLSEWLGRVIEWRVSDSE